VRRKDSVRSRVASYKVGRGRRRKGLKYRGNSIQKPRGSSTCIAPESAVARTLNARRGPCFDSLPMAVVLPDNAAHRCKITHKEQPHESSLLRQEHTFGRVDERPSELKAEHVLMPRIGYRLCWSTQPSCRLETGGPVIGTKAALCLSSWAGRLGVPKAFDQTTSRKQTRLELATRSRNALAAAEHSDDRYEETP